MGAEGFRTSVVVQPANGKVSSCVVVVVVVHPVASHTVELASNLIALMRESIEQSRPHPCNPNLNGFSFLPQVTTLAISFFVCTYQWHLGCTGSAIAL